MPSRNHTQNRPARPTRNGRERRHGAVLRVVLVALALLALLAGLTAFSTYVHFATWTVPSGGPGAASVIGEWPAKLIGNVVQVPTAPGWLAMNWINGGLAPFSWSFVIGANIMGWTPWVVALGVLIVLGRWLRGRRAPQSEEAAMAAAARAYARVDEQPAPASAGKSSATSVSGASANPSRRRLLVNAALGAPVVLSTGGLAYGTLVEPWRLRLARYTIPIRGLPRALDGLRIVQICDTHYGPRVPRSHIADAVQMALDLRPDIYALVGDYIHHGPTYRPIGYELLEPLARTGRAIGVLGNHDNFYGQHDAALAELAALGVHTIENERVFIDAQTRDIVRVAPDAPHPDGLCIAGIPDLATQRDRVDVRRALGGVRDSTPRLLFSHVPDAAELDVLTRAGGPRVDLMLSGHTHGGQVRLPFLGTPVVPSDFGQKYAHGLVRGPAFPVIVSAGVGVSILPIRVGVPPEVVEITLTSA
jgi:predicted MPP superfamily phosphohydrolase